MGDKNTREKKKKKKKEKPSINKKKKRMNLKVLQTKEEQPTLQEAQEFVGGLVQLIPIENEGQMLINEEGIMHELEVNYDASFIAGQVILGPAIVLEGAAKWD